MDSKYRLLFLYTLGIIEEVYNILEEAGITSSSLIDYLDGEVHALEHLMTLNTETLMKEMDLQRNEVDQN